MPELLTPDGEEIEAARAQINADFAAVMNDDSPGPAAPPRRQRSAVADGKPGRARGAKPPRDDRARSAARPAAASLSDAQRLEGAKGIAQVTAFAALTAAKATGNPAFAADAATIAVHGEALASACVETARTSPAFAAALDKVCAAGPYAALIGVGVTITAQLARNHKPDLVIPGTVDPRELLQAPGAGDQEEPKAA